MIFRYLKEKLVRKKARRVFQEYPYEIQSFNLPQEGNVEFANWKNPLITPVTVNQPEVNFFKQFISPGSLAIDIGTNTGDTTVPMALAAGKQGMIIGFDPNPHVFKIAEINAGLNKDKTNIVVFNYAITNEDGEFYYNSSEASFSNGGISDQPSKYHGAYSLSTKIKGIKLETFLEKNYADRLPKLSFIKIDTEGYDKEIIKSIHPLLKKYQPVIISECFSKATKEEREELFDSVDSLGYEVYYFSDFAEGADVQRIGKADMRNWKHFNFFAKPGKKNS